MIAVYEYLPWGVVLIVPCRRSDSGIIETTPVRTVPCGEWAAVGDLAMAALAEYDDTRIITRYIGYTWDTPKAVGATSESEFCRSVKTCHVVLEAGTVEIIPYTADGTGGFIPLNNSAIISEAISGHEKLGDLIRLGLELST
jgi:hypothetical protein